MSKNLSSFDKIRGTIGFIIAPLSFLLIITLPTPQNFVEYLQHNYPNLENGHIYHLAYGMKVVTALLFTMIILWITEAIPIPITALLPAIILPLFNVKGISENELYLFTGKNVLSNYANPIIYLFLSGFLIARAMQKWNLDRRLTYTILGIKNFANNTSLIVLALIIISAFLSMWISNTATTAMLLPLVLGIVKINSETSTKNFSKALAFAIAYGSSLGGIATIIGTPPNGICISILRNSGINDINFINWLKIGLPITIIFIPLTWLLLLKLFPPEIKKIKGGKNYINELKKELGPFSKAEFITLLCFVLLLLLWLSHPFWNYILPEKIFSQLKNFDENLIALSIAILLFIVPVNWEKRIFVLEWKDSKAIDWGTLLLFGGGIALSDAMFKTGLAGWIASSSVEIIGNASPFILVVVIVILIDFLTEVTSNTAVTSMMVPILLSMAIGMNIDGKLLTISATLASSMAFMLPVATPPNAIIYGSGLIKITDMIKIGLLMDIIAWFVIPFSLYFFSHLLFQIISF